MSRRARPRENAKPANERAEMAHPSPLKPRRGWFIGLMVAFAIWVGFLAVLYVKTVYWPHHPR